MNKVLLINADYTPIKIISWERAINLVLEGTVELIEEYVGKAIRSAHDSWPFPAVVKLLKYLKAPIKIRFNRSNVMARDGYCCQYCGVAPVNTHGKPDLNALSLDHVIARSKAVDGKVLLSTNEHVQVTWWRNVVTCCMRCNLKKSDKTVEQAGMRLKAIPRAPTAADVLYMSLTRVDIPSEWADYLPKDKLASKLYWELDLDPT